MRYDFDDLYEGPRLQNRLRKRKMKWIISSIVALTCLVILIVVINYFPGGKEETSGKIADQNQTDEQMASTEDSEEMDSDDDNDLVTEPSGQATVNDEPSTNQASNKKSTKSSSESSTSQKPNETLVIGTIEKNWDPVGTTQQGEHRTDFSEDSQDWQEMTKAVSVATGLPKDNMIIWWMGNGGGPDKVVSTVSSKDKQNYYRVQLVWEDNNGWKPVLVEQLQENDRKQMEPLIR